MSNCTIELFGLMANNEVIDSCELANKNGMLLRIMGYGATVTSLKIPLKNGKLIDVVLGFDTLNNYVESFDQASAPYFGCTVGRFAGRIKEGIFTLNSNTFYLHINNNKNSLHGGKEGFSQKLWKITSEQQGENPSVTLHYTSLDKEESYPGELAVQVTYTVSQDNELIIEYHATTTQDTIVNLTNHSYFNLNGHQSDVLDQELFINSKKILETTAELIPTGVFLDTINADMDFNKPKNCPEIIDNTFILNCNKEMAASLYSKENNLKMEVYTTQPAVHVYVGGNCLDSLKGKEGIYYHSSSGICFETQNFPDAPNHKHFPNSVLKKGEVYYHKTIYKFLSL